jgi:S-adenosylmethionine:tRNA ribosyltransferase-isomerase
MDTSSASVDSHLSPDERLSAYDFELPGDRIAQEPAEKRDESRLLVVRRAGGAAEHRRFSEIGGLLDPGDLLVLNDTKVIPARARGVRERTGGRCEALFLSWPAGGPCDALVGTRGRLECGERLSLLDGALTVELVERGERGRWRLLPIPPATDVGALLRARGEMPLPPYIKRRTGDPAQRELDRERYQTVYAAHPGAVAAPTAGLHFTPATLADLGTRGVDQARVTLHVGAGTFQPVETEDLSRHVMHEERYDVPAETADAHARARAARRRVLAVGTTAVRALESAWDPALGRIRAGAGATRLFLRPPAAVQAADALLTNFHLPRSTLLMLVAAFIGRERLLELYREAIARRYRFFSYGDAMLIL